MSNYVITISREHGSGGHSIGKRLAELLAIPFYDREVVELTAQRHGLDADSARDLADDARVPLPFGLGGGFGAFAETSDRMFILQSQTVISLAKQPCVIVGRCADFILRNHPARYSFFVYSGIRQRMTHMKQHAGLYHTEDPIRQMEKIDRRRAAYYKYHTGQEWGKPPNDHLCVDSGVLGVHTADLLASFVSQAEKMRGGVES